MKKMTEQEYMDREAKYGAHNYHPLSRGVGERRRNLRVGCERETLFRFSVGLFCREPGALPPEDRERQ